MFIVIILHFIHYSIIIYLYKSHHLYDYVVFIINWIYMYLNAEEKKKFVPSVAGTLSGILL